MLLNGKAASEQESNSVLFHIYEIIVVQLFAVDYL